MRVKSKKMWILLQPWILPRYEMMFYVGGWIVMHVFTLFYQEIVFDTSYKTILRCPGIYYTETFVVFLSALFYTMKVKELQVGMNI